MPSKIQLINEIDELIATLRLLQDEPEMVEEMIDELEAEKLVIANAKSK